MKTAAEFAVIGLIGFLVFASVYNIGLASDSSRAYLVLLCGALFFASSLVSSFGRIGRSIGDAVSWFATITVAFVVLVSLPLPVSFVPLLVPQTATVYNVSQGDIDGTRLAIHLDVVNAEINILGWNLSGYQLLSELTARALTQRAAERLLSRCALKVDTRGENMTIGLSGSRLLRQRMKSVITLRLPTNVTTNLYLSAINGTVNLTRLESGAVRVHLSSGFIVAESMRAWTCDMSVEKGRIAADVDGRKISLRTSSGGIVLESLRPETDIELETVKGPIAVRLNLSRDVGCSVEASTIGGYIRVNLTNVVFTRRTTGFVLARTKDLEDKKFKTTVVARSTAGNITISQV